MDNDYGGAKALIEVQKRNVFAQCTYHQNRKCGSYKVAYGTGVTHVSLQVARKELQVKAPTVVPKYNNAM
eukprot:10244426-Ditylum_brightwellii.AAC.1